MKGNSPARLPPGTAAGSSQSCCASALCRQHSLDTSVAFLPRGSSQRLFSLEIFETEFIRFHAFSKLFLKIFLVLLCYGFILNSPCALFLTTCLIKDERIFTLNSLFTRLLRALQCTCLTLQVLVILRCFGEEGGKERRINPGSGRQCPPPPSRPYNTKQPPHSLYFILRAFPLNCLSASIFLVRIVMILCFQNTFLCTVYTFFNSPRNLLQITFKSDPSANPSAGAGAQSLFPCAELLSKRRSGAKKINKLKTPQSAIKANGEHF